ncbi:MAG: HAMP domain-containing protein, partial [Anaerolineae bacterium]|nr:HAMP domain-containing protein [Anaerolineae bacterium]
MAPVEAQRRIAVLMVILIAGTVVVAAVGMGQLLTGPVTRLIAAAEQIIGGDLTAQAHVESGDEIGMLAMTFNRMTTQLRDLISSLEQEVAKRT